jgi:hypothetical protein
MDTKFSPISRMSILTIIVVLTLLAFPSQVGPVEASSGVATNTKLNIQSALFFFDDGGQSRSVFVTRDTIANTTSLYFANVFPDPNDPNQTIYINGEQAEIPNSAFTMNSSSAQLTLTTPDSYAVTRCVVNNETYEYTCATTGPSTFYLTWLADGYSSFHESGNTIETFGQNFIRSRGQFDQESASVNVTWDDFSATNLAGVLTIGENATLFRERMMRADPHFLSFLAVKPHLEPTQMPSAKLNFRDAFTILSGDDLNGFVSVARNEIARTTFLTFAYAFPDASDPSIIALYFAGQGEIPNSAFNITSTSARLTVTTTDSLFVLRCVITGIIGLPGGGGYTCAPSTTPVTFDLTWTKDGYGSIYATGKSVETVGSAVTRYQREDNRVTAKASGTWSEMNTHSGINMIADLTTLQVVTIDQGSP